MQRSTLHATWFIYCAGCVSKRPVPSSSCSTAILEAGGRAVSPARRVGFKPGMAVPLQKELPLQKGELSLPERPRCLLRAPRRGSLGQPAPERAFSGSAPFGTFDSADGSANTGTQVGAARCGCTSAPRPPPHTRSEDRRGSSYSRPRRHAHTPFPPCYSGMCSGEGGDSPPTPSQAGGVLFEHDPGCPPRLPTIRWK